MVCAFLPTIPFTMPGPLPAFSTNYSTHSPRRERCCQGFRQIPRVEHHRLKEDAKPAPLLDEPQRQVVLRDPTRRLEPKLHREMPSGRHPMRRDHDMAFHIPLGLRIPDRRHLLHRLRVTVVFEDRVVDHQQAPAGLREAGVLQNESDQPPHHAVRRPRCLPEEAALRAGVPMSREEIIEGLHRKAGRDDQPNHVLGKVLELVGSAKTIAEAVQQLCPHRRNTHHRPHRRLLLRRSCNGCCVASTLRPPGPNSCVLRKSGSSRTSSHLLGPLCRTVHTDFPYTALPMPARKAIRKTAEESGVPVGGRRMHLDTAASLRCASVWPERPAASGESSGPAAAPLAATRQSESSAPSP